jgi:hypothetical protein
MGILDTAPADKQETVRTLNASMSNDQSATVYPGVATIEAHHNSLPAP